MYTKCLFAARLLSISNFGLRLPCNAMCRKLDGSESALKFDASIMLRICSDSSCLFSVFFFKIYAFFLSIRLADIIDIILLIMIIIES